MTRPSKKQMQYLAKNIHTSLNGFASLEADEAGFVLVVFPVEHDPSHIQFVTNLDDRLQAADILFETASKILEHEKDTAPKQSPSA